MSESKMVIPEECIPFLKKNITNYKKYTDPDDLLDEISDIQLYKGFTPDQQELNNFGIEAERVYDKIYYANLQCRLPAE